MSKLHTHYDNLKVSRDAPEGVIKAAYKALAQSSHPDRCSDPKATKRMQLINEAYAVLSDSQKRAEHDTWIQEQESCNSRPSSPYSRYNPPPTQPETKKAAPNENAQISRLRELHRSDLHQLRQVHALEIERLKRTVGFQKKFYAMVGLMVAIPAYIAVASLDEAINKSPDQQYQEATMKRY